MESKKTSSTKKSSSKAKEYDIEWILNPLAQDERVIRSSRSPTEHDIVQGNEASGYIKTFAEHDEGNHLKLFLMSENKDAVFKLSKSAKAVYLWILYSLKHKTDRIFIPPTKCCTEIGMVENTFARAIRELQKSRIIHRIGVRGSENYHEFYIAPLFMFRGKRFDYYRRFLDRNRMYLDSKED